MEAKLPEITLGETACRKLKDIYFKDEKWPDCYKKVAEKFTELRCIGRNFYGYETELEIIKELARYSEKDILEAFDEKDCSI